jgi:membrane-bound metal-dependent hydrolase YbcI (DUF457 family)
MDPLSHMALGASLGALTAGEARIRGVVPAAVAGSLIPDLDAVVAPFGWDRYLRIHEIGTHSLPGTMACALVAALLVHRQPRAREWRLVLLAAWLGAAAHVLLDLVSSARIRALWPIVERQVSIPLVAMGDPWLAAILALAIPALWLGDRFRRRAVAGVLCAALGFLGVKAIRARSAVGHYLESMAEPETYFVEARWASLGEWHVYDRHAGAVRQWRAGSGGVQLVTAWQVGAEAPIETASRRLESVRNFVGVHQLAFPVAVDTADGTRVLWSDPRFCWRPAAGARRLDPLITGPDGAMSCAVWAGGDFDRRGTALRQIVHVFGFTQTRDAGE